MAYSLRRFCHHSAHSCPSCCSRCSGQSCCPVPLRTARVWAAFGDDARRIPEGAVPLEEKSGRFAGKAKQGLMPAAGKRAAFSLCAGAALSDPLTSLSPAAPVPPVPPVPPPRAVLLPLRLLLLLLPHLPLPYLLTLVCALRDSPGFLFLIPGPPPP